MLVGELNGPFSCSCADVEDVDVLASLDGGPVEGSVHEDEEDVVLRVETGLFFGVIW